AASTMAPAGESLVTSSIKRPFSSKTPMHHLSPSFFRNTYFWNSPVFSADSIAYSIWREYPFNLSLIHDANATSRIPWFLGILPNHPSIFKKHRCFCPDLDAEDRLRHQPVKRISLISFRRLLISESIPLNSFPDISQFRPPSPLKPFQLEGRQKSGSPGTSEQVRLLLFDRYQAPCLFQCFKLAFTGSGSLPRKFLRRPFQIGIDTLQFLTRDRLFRLSFAENSHQSRNQQ